MFPFCSFPFEKLWLSSLPEKALDEAPEACAPILWSGKGNIFFLFYQIFNRKTIINYIMFGFVSRMSYLCKLI